MAHTARAIRPILQNSFDLATCILEIIMAGYRLHLLLRIFCSKAFAL